MSNNPTTPSRHIFSFTLSQLYCTIKLHITFLNARHELFTILSRLFYFPIRPHANTSGTRPVFFFLLVSSKVTAAKVTETRVNIQLLVETGIDLGSDNLHGGELGHNCSDTLRARDQVQEEDPLLCNSIVDQSLDGLDCRTSSGYLFI